MARGLVATAAPPTGDDGWTAACHAIAGRAANPAPLPRETPLVTILICTFNRAKMVREAIASAKAQRWPVEIVVVDDGSTDDTPAILSQIPEIHTLRQPNGGKPSALNAGMRAASGEAILVLDDDDLLLPDAVTALATALFANPELVAVYGDTIVFDGVSGQPLDYRPAVRTPGPMARRAVLTQIPAMPGATLVRTSAQIAAGDYDLSLIRGQDMDMYLRLSDIGPMEAIALPTFLYRSHDGARGSAAGQWQKKRDPAEHHRRFLACVQPVFRARWEAGTAHGRAEGMAWVLGLWERGLQLEAREEAERWRAPYNPMETWVRARVGLGGEASVARDNVVVIDDGDEGALEETLWRHAAGRAVHVAMAHPRDPVGSVQMWWPGRYAMRVRLTTFVPNGVVHFRLSSAPDWAPPPISGACLPELSPTDAIISLAAALNWDLPVKSRGGSALHPVAKAFVAARMAMRRGAHREALGLLAAALERVGNWAPGWRMARACFAAMGMSAEGTPIHP